MYKPSLPQLSLALLTGLLFFTAPAGAQAAPDDFQPHPYVALRGAYQNLSDTSLNYEDGITPSVDVGFENGYAIGVAAGWQFTPNWRAEGELGYRENSLLIVTPGNNPDGSARATTMMVNGYFDLPTKTLFTPYIGAGIGAAYLQQDIAASGTQITDEHAWAFAYQGMIGASATLTDTVSANLEYRYMATSEPLYKDVTGSFYKSRYGSNAVMAGLTFHLQ